MRCKICKKPANQRIKSKYFCKTHGHQEANYFPDNTDIINVDIPEIEISDTELDNPESLSGFVILDMYYFKPSHKMWNKWRSEIIKIFEANEREIECLDCGLTCLINERDFEIDNDRCLIWSVCPKRKCKSERFKYV